MAQANIKAVITADDRASGALQNFGNNANKTFGGVTKKVAGLAAAYLSVRSATDIIGQAIKRVDTLSNSTRTFENLGFATKDVDKAMKSLDNSIRGLPTPLDEAVRGMTLIASATNDIGKSQKIYTALNDAILGFGGSAEMVSNAVVQLSQDLAGGRITAQTWMSLLNSGLGPALAAMARQMGLTTQELRDGLSKGTISVKEFTNQLIEMDQKGGGGMKSFAQIAKDSTNGIQTSWANLQTAIVRGVANLINTIGQANIAGFINNIRAAFEALIPIIGTLMIPVVKALAGALSVLLTILVPVLNFMASHRPVVYALATAFIALKVAMNFNAIVGAFVGRMAAARASMIATTGTVRVMYATLLANPFAIVAAAGVAAGVAVANAWIRARNAINAAKAAAETAHQAQIQAYTTIGDQLRAGKISKETAQKLVKQVGGRATGGPVMGGTPYVVGEQGPELFVPNQGGNIVPNNRMSSGGTTVINISPNIGIYAGTPSERRKLALTLLEDLRDLATQKNTTVSMLLGANRTVPMS